MAGARRTVTAPSHRKPSWLVLLAAGAVAAGAAGALWAGGQADSRPAHGSGANASDVTGPAAASGWG